MNGFSSTHTRRELDAEFGICERPGRCGVVLRRNGGTHRHYNLKFNFTSLDCFRLRMVLIAEYVASVAFWVPSDICINRTVGATQLC
jgi:hypothetical protein